MEHILGIHKFCSVTSLHYSSPTFPESPSPPPVFRLLSLVSHLPSSFISPFLYSPPHLFLLETALVGRGGGRVPLGVAKFDRQEERRLTARRGGGWPPGGAEVDRQEGRRLTAKRSGGWPSGGAEVDRQEEGCCLTSKIGGKELCNCLCTAP